MNYTQRYKKWKQFTTPSFANLGEQPLWTIHKDTKNESNSQHTRSSIIVYLRCELYTKIQKMKAIHNTLLYLLTQVSAVNYTQRYKKWKQFTTRCPHMKHESWLWTIHKDTKNESNSQRSPHEWPRNLCCELYTKIQKMKAIHNVFTKEYRSIFAVNYTQRYKKWKQFTTADGELYYRWELWTIHKDTKNESNSQLRMVESLPRRCCELYTKIQKMKAIHNHTSTAEQVEAAVNYTQRYKKWKQFTTCAIGRIFQICCELYTKIQKMKAIHNRRR